MPRVPGVELTKSFPAGAMVAIEDQVLVQIPGALPLVLGRGELWEQDPMAWYRAQRGPQFLPLPTLFTDRPLPSLGEREGVGQRADAKVARGWACAWSQMVSKECHTPGGVTLRTSAPSGVS